MAPLGIVTIVDRAGREMLSPRVDIYSYDDIYRTIGGTAERFEYWQRKYGMDSLGEGDNGEMFLPEFPVFSKIAWMFIEPVDLSRSETSSLVGECEAALARAHDQHVLNEIGQIRDLAERALRVCSTLRCGHP